MNVLLLHDNSHDVEPLRETLRKEGFDVELSTSTAMATALIHDRTIAAVLVSVKSLDDPRVQLVRTWRAAGLYQGPLVLLCPPRLAEDGYRLCRNGAFDDYVTVNPLYDAFQLRLAVRRGLVLHGATATQKELTSAAADVAATRQSTIASSGQLEADWDALREMVMRTLTKLAQRKDAAKTNEEPQSRSDEHSALLRSVAGLHARQGELVAAVTSQLSAVAKTLSRARRPPGPLLLLVDDDPAFFEVMEAVLRALDYRLAWTSEPTDTIGLLKEFKPAAVLLDIDMPTMSGIDVLRAIRNDPALASTPVILLTVHRDRTTVLAAKELGVNGYLIKPPERADIARQLAAITHPNA